MGPSVSDVALRTVGSGPSSLATVAVVSIERGRAQGACDTAVSGLAQAFTGPLGVVVAPDAAYGIARGAGQAFGSIKVVVAGARREFQWIPDNISNADKQKERADCDGDDPEKFFLVHGTPRQSPGRAECGADVYEDEPDDPTRGDGRMNVHAVADHKHADGGRGERGEQACDRDRFDHL